MYLEFTDDQLELRDNVRSVLAGACPPTLVRGIFEGTATTDELWAQQVELFWPALAIPESLGGVGLGAVEVAIVCDELGRAAAPGPLLPTLTQFVPALLEAAGPNAERLLAGVIEGTAGTLAVAERNRWDLSLVTTSATPTAGGGYVLDGVKTGVFSPSTAAEMAVVARSADGALGLFVVPREAVSVVERAILDPAVPLGDVTLAGAEVPPDRVVVAPGDPRADAVLARTLEHATLGVALGMVGACRRITEETVDYAKIRVQYDKPIGSFQALKHRMADMFLAVERATAVCYYAALTIAERDARRAEAVAMAKSVAGDCQRLVAEDGLQLHGGIGYTWENDLHFLLKRAKCGEVLFGTSVSHRSNIARSLGLLDGAPSSEAVAS